jgi:hypothetical protein
LEVSEEGLAKYIQEKKRTIPYSLSLSCLFIEELCLKKIHSGTLIPAKEREWGIDLPGLM